VGKSPEVLYLNFAGDISQAYRQFIHRHTQIRDSVLRQDLFDLEVGYFSSKQANRGCRQLIEKLENVGYEVIAGGPLHNPYWQVYVIEIDGDPRHLYVGETNYPVEKRFQQHVHKFNPARVLLRYDNFELAMQYAAGWPKAGNKEASLRNETALADKLRKKGYKVEGGH